jgi:hypothetical protein
VRAGTSKISVPTDLGVPAFNIGSKAFSTQDFANGLGLNQWCATTATTPKAMQYRIVLKYIFYDVFGLDDKDLRRFGAASDSFVYSKAAIAITAWWQLQHQHGYAPLVTRIILEKTFEVPAV